MEVFFVQMLFLVLVISTVAGFWWLIRDYDKKYGWRSDYDDNYHWKGSDKYRSRRTKKKHK